MKTALAPLLRAWLIGLAKATAFVLSMNEKMWTDSLALRHYKHLFKSLNAKRRAYHSQLHWQYSEISRNLQLAIVTSLFAVSPSWDFLRAHTANADTNRASFFVVI